MKALALIAGLLLAACTTWDAPMTPPDGGPATAPIGHEVFCVKNKGHKLCQ